MTGKRVTVRIPEDLYAEVLAVAAAASKRAGLPPPTISQVILTALRVWAHDLGVRSSDSRDS